MTKQKMCTYKRKAAKTKYFAVYLSGANAVMHGNVFVGLEVRQTIRG